MPNKLPRNSPAQSEESAAVEAFKAYLETERKTKYDSERPDPPDLALKDRTTGHRIAIEHTRIIQEDLSYVTWWYYIYDALRAAGAGGLPGQFFVRPDIRAPLPKPGRERDQLVRATIDAIRNTDWQSTKSITIPGPQGIKVVLIEATGSDIVGIRPHAHFPTPQRERRLRDLITEKLRISSGLTGFNERILLVETTYVSAVEVGTCWELIIDEIEWARQGGPVPVDSVYLIRDRGGAGQPRFDIHLAWP